MTRSISFVAEGDVRTLVTVTENSNGTLSFDVEVIGATVGDLRALFFDLNDFEVAEADLYIVDQAATDVTDTASGEGDVDTLGRDANIKGSVSNELGDFDVGIELGTSGLANDDIQTTNFTLASYSSDLTLDMLNFADFGFRYTSVGDAGGDRTASAKIGDTTGGTATDDTITLLEEETATINLLANDLALGSVTAQTVTLENAAGGFGTLTIAADGTATAVADGPAADALDDGESASFIVSYEVADGDDRATASVTVTINGTTDVVLDPLFTEGDDVVVFDTILQGDYAPGTQYDAGGGNDEVNLPTDSAAALAAGYDATQAFNAGPGKDVVRAGSLNDTVYMGEGNDRLSDSGGTQNFFDLGDGFDRASLNNMADDFIDGGTGFDTLEFQRSGLGITADIDGGTATGQGSDTFTGFERYGFTNSDDVVIGSASNITSFLYAGDDIYTGSNGSEIIILTAGTNSIDGGMALDRVSYQDAISAVVVNLDQGWATGPVNDTISNVEQATGTRFDDTLTGLDGAYDALIGLDGNDRIFGLGGDDDLTQAGDGDDSVYGGAGDDILGGQAGNDLLDGGDGSDTAYYVNTSEGVTISLTAGIATQGTDTDTLVSIENVTGSNFSDTIIGDAGDNLLNGFRGGDVLTGLAGADTFRFDVRQTALGDNTITDFEVGVDTVQLGSGAANGLNSLAALNPQQIGSDVVLTVTFDNTIKLENIDLATLSDSDFTF